MYDGVDSDARVIPANAQLIAYYIDGNYKWTDAEIALFPHSVHVPIAVHSTTNNGIVLDCERGDATPAESVDWVVMRRKAGADPTVYCNQNDPQTGWPAVRAAFKARGVPEPHYWVANYNGDTTIPAGATAHQYKSTASWDLSSVADFWPGVDKEPAAPVTQEEDDMQQIEPLHEHPGEYAYGTPAGKTKINFFADGYSMAPAKLRVVAWVGPNPQVHDGQTLGGSSKIHSLTIALPSGCTAVTVRRADTSEFPVGVNFS